MVLKRHDIACFVANWDDKATNLRRIADALNIGLDSLVFVDDNPMERDLVRQELPMVAVPEVTEDPESFIAALAAGGYFEALAITDEDRDRTALYAGNQAREALRGQTTDLDSLPPRPGDAPRLAPLRSRRPAAHRPAHQQVEPVQPHHHPLHRRNDPRGDGGPAPPSACNSACWTGSATTA